MLKYFTNKIKTNDFNKNDYLTIEYFNKKYPEIEEFKKIQKNYFSNTDIQIYSENLDTPTKKNTNKITFIRKGKINRGLYEYDSGCEMEYDIDYSNDLKKKYPKVLINIAFSTIVLISLIMIRYQFFN